MDNVSVLAKCCQIQHRPTMSTTLVTKLNYDILVEIMRILADEGTLSSSALAAMSQTCKHMNLEGAPLLLSGTVVVLRRIPSFCYFMLRDRTTRFPLLRRLRVAIREVTEDTIELFSEVLHHAVDLYYLDTKEFHHPSPPVRVALCSLMSSLTSVRHLRLWGGQLRRQFATLGGLLPDDPHSSVADNHKIA